MPDISLCYGEGCGDREDCFRFRAEPHPTWQSYANFDDLRQGAEKCGAFWPLDRAISKLRDLTTEEAL